jgi:hypothetical protein
MIFKYIGGRKMKKLVRTLAFAVAVAMVVAVFAACGGKYFSVTFDYNGGDDVERGNAGRGSMMPVTEWVKSGDTAESVWPEVPVQNSPGGNRHFQGWFVVDADGEMTDTRFTPTTAVTADIIVRAKWGEVPHVCNTIPAYNDFGNPTLNAQNRWALNYTGGPEKYVYANLPGEGLTGVTKLTVTIECTSAGGFEFIIGAFNVRSDDESVDLYWDPGHTNFVGLPSEGFTAAGTTWPEPSIVSAVITFAVPQDIAMFAIYMVWTAGDGPVTFTVNSVAFEGAGGAPITFNMANIEWGHHALFMHAEVPCTMPGWGICQEDQE